MRHSRSRSGGTAVIYSSRRNLKVQHAQRGTNNLSSKNKTEPPVPCHFLILMVIVLMGVCVYFLFTPISTTFSAHFGTITICSNDLR